MNLTNIFGKQVFALYEGEVVGTIVEAYFNVNFTKISKFKIFDSEENEFEINVNGIKAINDCVIISNKNKLLPFYEINKRSPLFKQVVDSNAKELGKILDCQIDNKCNVEHFVTDKQINLLPNNIHLRKNFVLYQEGKVYISKPKNTKIKSLENIKVNILSDSRKDDNFSPTKVPYNTDSLIGKTAKDNLFGINNEIIVKANQVITEKIIIDATRHNRLNQLYFLVR